MSVLQNFDEWKSFLSERVQQAQQSGMNDKTIANLAYEMGDYLSAQVDPKNEQQRLLKELWDASDESEQQTLAKIMVKMVQKQG